jgi:uncharacterized membrane protein YdcZ (DUF606 family)
MPSKLIDPAALPTMTFDWGVIKPLVATDNTDDPAVSLMHVVLLPGQGHERHNHPDADEILYILAGTGDQMVDDGEPFPVRALGAGGLTAVTFAGQLGVAIVIDHFGWLGVERSPITVAKVSGVLLLAVGTWLVIRD